MWFDPRLDRLRDEALIPAIKDAGFEPIIVSKREHVNRIDDEIVSLIRQSRFVVADFTGNRGGVYFEAGFAHALKLPVVWTCERSRLIRRKLHFDIEHFNFLPWDANDCPGFKTALQRRIEHVAGLGPNRSSH